MIAKIEGETTCTTCGAELHLIRYPDENNLRVRPKDIQPKGQEYYDQLCDLSRRMADALWALAHDKKPDDDPLFLNQEYYNRTHKFYASD